MKKQRLESDVLVRIPVDSGAFAIGRILKPPFVAVYDCLVKEDSATNEYTVTQPVLFIVAVMDWAVKTGRWQIVGNVSPGTEKVPIPNQFIQDRLDPLKCKIINSLGVLRVATIEECEGLERAAVWEPEHVEQRIKDYYAGRKNVYVESMKLRR